MSTPIFFFVNSNSPCKDLLVPRGLILAQKPLYFVGTVLKHGEIKSSGTVTSNKDKYIGLRRCNKLFFHVASYWIVNNKLVGA